MFSLEGLPLDSETLEYGWLIEVIVGELTGKLTTPQVTVSVHITVIIMCVVREPQHSGSHIVFWFLNQTTWT